MLSPFPTGSALSPIANLEKSSSVVARVPRNLPNSEPLGRNKFVPEDQRNSLNLKLIELNSLGFSLACREIRSFLDKSEKYIWHADHASEVLKVANSFVDYCSNNPNIKDYRLLGLLAFTYKKSPDEFNRILTRFKVLAASENYDFIKVPYRIALKQGLRDNHCLQTITAAFQELVENKELLTAKYRGATIEFLRGVVLNSWNSASSIKTLISAITIQKHISVALRLAGKSTTEIKPDKSRRFIHEEIVVSPVLDFLAQGAASLRELNLIESCFNGADAQQQNNKNLIKLVCCVLESCRYSSAPNALSSIEKKIHYNLEKKNNLESTLMLALKELSHAVDNRGIRSLVNKVSNAENTAAIKQYLDLLRTIYKADILDERTALSEKTIVNYEKQQEIFFDSLDSFQGFEQARSFVKIVSQSDLQDFPNGDFSLLPRFAHELAEVKALNISGRKGYVISNFIPERCFSLDLAQEDPFEHYRTSSMYKKLPLEEFGSQRAIVAGAQLIITMPDYQINGINYSAVYCADNELNIGNTLALLVPTICVNQIIDNSSYDLLSVPEQCPDIKTLSEYDLLPDALICAAIEANLPWFDVGAGTNVGGHSNSLEPNLSPYHQFAKQSNQASFQDRDLWQHVKKRSLLDKAECFGALCNLHREIHFLVSKFNSQQFIFEDRLAAWKKGNTPDNSFDDERSWLNPVDGMQRQSRLLYEVFKWHYLSRATASDSSQTPELHFWKTGRSSEGPIPDFYIETKNPRIVIGSSSYSLNVTNEKVAVESVDEIARRFCFSDQAQQVWNIEVLPRLGGLMPGFVFG